MTPEQARFAAFIEENEPELLHLFDFEKAEFKPEAVEAYMKVASSGEKHIARFVVGVWRGHNQFEFDLLGAVKALSGDKLSTIRKWLADPIWP